MCKHQTNWFFLLLLLWGISNRTFAQTNVQDSLLFQSFFDRIDIYKYNKPDKAYLYCDSILTLAEKKNYPSQAVKSLFVKAEIAVMNRQLSLMEESIQLANRKIALHHKKLQPFLRLFERENQSVEMHYQNTIDHQQRAIAVGEALIDSLENSNDLSLAENELLKATLISLLSIYHKIGDYSNALDCYMKLEVLGFKSITTYSAAIHYAQGNYQLAIQEYKREIQNLKQLESKNINRPNRFVAAYQGLAETYLAEDKIDEALASLSHSLPYQKKKDFYRINTYKLFGKINSRGKRYSKAHEHFTEALTHLNQHIQGEKNHQFASVYLEIGSLYQKQNQLEKALDYYQQALIHLAPDFNDEDYRSNPKIENIDLKMLLLNVLTIKAEVLFLLSEQKQEDFDLLDLSKKTTVKAVELIDLIRLEYSSEKDKELLVDKSYSIFELAINLALKTDNPKEAFYWSERSRAIVLEEALQNRQAQMLAQVDKATLLGIQELRANISYNYKLLNIARAETKVKSFRSELLSLKTQYQKLIQTVAEDQRYQKALATQQGFDTHTLDQLQNQLAPDEALVEFFVGEKQLFAFMVQGGQAQIVSQRIAYTQPLRTAIANINDYLSDEEDQLYVEAATLIYKELFSELFKQNMPTRLTIVPDGQLGGLPFAALLYEPIKPADIGIYPNYPYLIKEMSIGLAFSIPSLFNQENQKAQTKSAKNILAYAPSFREIDLNNITDPRRDLLLNLTSSKSEVKQLKQKYDAEILLDTFATSQHFMEHAGTANILHLSTHGIVDQKKPDLSFIAFSNIPKRYHDNEAFKVTVSDLYAQNIPCQMVVLSACKTGVGKAIRGEGIMSIARAFAYAGTQSIVTSLWNVDGQKTADVMDNFYTQLRQSQAPRKDEALRQAMLQYLHSTSIDLNKRSPKYWAAFTVIGNPSPIDWADNFISRNLYWMGAGVFPGSLFLFLIIWRRRKKQAGISN